MKVGAGAETNSFGSTTLEKNYPQRLVMTRRRHPDGEKWLKVWSPLGKSMENSIDNWSELRKGEVRIRHRMAQIKMMTDIFRKAPQGL